MLLNCGVGEDSWESLGLHGNRSVLNNHWKDWCWSWNANPLATWCKELTRWKRPWSWERLKAEGDNRGCNGWMASPTRWTWVWASSGSWWWTGRPGVLQSMWLQRVGHDWVTKLMSFTTGLGKKASACLYIYSLNAFSVFFFYVHKLLIILNKP